MADFSKKAGAAIVVGASGGIGSAISLALANAKCRLAITCRRNKDAAEAVLRSVRDAGVEAKLYQVDLVDENAVANTVETVGNDFGAIHTVVHAAGTYIDQPFISQLTPKHWREVMHTDTDGFFNVVHATLPHLRSSQGSYVFVSSAGLKRFPPGDVLSVAPKGAIEALLQGIAKEEGRYGVRANSVALGIIDAGMFPKLVESGELNERYLEASKRNTALRRFGRPEEVADAVVFLASDKASYITGQMLMLDGGYSV
ncbi:MAG: SDR family NAD(P)-dependent oxidoreductase [Polyangiales bacterium]